MIGFEMLWNRLRARENQSGAPKTIVKFGSDAGNRTSRTTKHSVST